MEYKPGLVVEGKVVKITNFGAFVQLEDGQEGLVHISEIANEFVTDINKFVQMGAEISVKILGRNSKNKLELSVRKVESDENDPAQFITKRSKNEDFENKVTSFLKRSDEKQVDIRRNLKFKQGIKKKK